jgi:hypothetical protein
MLQSLKTFCKHSVTVAWGYAQIAGGAIVAGLHSAGSYAGEITSNPDVKEALTQFNSIPKWIIPALIVFGYVTVSARIRTLNPVQVINNKPVPGKKVKR